MPAAPATGDLPLTLRAAAAVVVVEAIVQAVVVGGRSELTVGLRGLLVAGILLKVAFAWRMLHRSHGAALGVLLLEGTTVLAAVGADGLATGPRLALGITPLVVMALVLASLHAFPAPTLPRP